MKLLIVSHVRHYKHNQGYYAYGPYAREIEVWCDLFSEVVIAAPCREEPPAADAYLIHRGNVTVAPQKEVGGPSWREKAGIAFALPALIAGLTREMCKADAIHVRCPGNLGLLGALLAPLFSSRLIAKYAGQWGGYAGEEPTVRLQRAVLRSRWWRGPVTVYGKFPGERPNVISFFSSMFTAQQLSRARAGALSRRIGSPLTVAFAGRLTRNKNVDTILRALAIMKGQGIPLKGLVIGEGPEMESLTRLAKDLGIGSQVEFVGGVSPERIPSFLERADVFVLGSHTEGWPKAIAEAMAFGLVCIGSNVGLIPMFLADGRGFTVPPGDVTALAQTLEKIASAPEKYESMRQCASEWAQKYSLESLRDSLQALMVEKWNLSSQHFLALARAQQTE